MPVSIRPGQTAFTRMPCPPRSQAVVCVRLMTPALAALIVRHAWHTIQFGELTAVLEFPIGWVYAVVAALVVAALVVLLSGWRAPAEKESDSL